MTEYWDLFKEPDGTDWLVLTTAIVDPTYLQAPYETSPAFIRPTRFALETNLLQRDYYQCWQGLKKHFRPESAKARKE
jgi:homogentisate 1,2-dioxygenase